MDLTCGETVSILYALIFGAGEACVRIDLWSILSAFGAFMIVVVIAQFIARRTWARLTAPRTVTPHKKEPSIDRPFKDDPNYQDSAIRTTKR